MAAIVGAISDRSSFRPKAHAARERARAPPGTLGPPPVNAPGTPCPDSGAFTFAPLALGVPARLSCATPMADRSETAVPTALEALGRGAVLWMLLAVAAVAGALYAFGVAGEEGTATALVVAASLAAGLLVARAAAAGSGPGRTLGLAAAVAVPAAVLLPSIPTVWPGPPAFEGELRAVGDEVRLPSGARGRVRLLVTGALGERGEPSVRYVLGGTRQPVEGGLERTYGSVRVGRSGRTRIARDHVADWHDASLADGAASISLQRLAGRPGGPIHVAGWAPILPRPAGPWLLAALALLLATAAEARLGRRNAVAVPAGMALAFGLLVNGNATPTSAVGPVVGAVILGAALGPIAGWLAAAVARRLHARAGPQRRARAG